MSVPNPNTQEMETGSTEQARLLRLPKLVSSCSMWKAHSDPGRHLASPSEHYMHKHSYTCAAIYNHSVRDILLYFTDLFLFTAYGIPIIHENFLLKVGI